MFFGQSKKTNTALSPCDHIGRSRYDVWQFDNGSNTGSPFWKQLFESPYFHRRLVARWYELTIGGPLAYDTVMALIDSLEAAHYDAVPRDKARWPHLVADYDYHMWIMRQWISDRYEWINKQFQEDAEELTVEPQLSPNPTNGILNLVGIAKGDNVELVEVYDMQGALVIRRTVNESTSVIDISSLPADIYMTRTVIDGRSVYQKIVKL